MITLISPHFVLPAVTEDDLMIASLAWGFTIGFGWLTTWTALKQTMHIYKRSGRHIFNNAYVWMIWLEILICLLFSILAWLHLRGVIPPSFIFYFGLGIPTWSSYCPIWMLTLRSYYMGPSVQFLLQIIINRCALLLMDRKKANYMKACVATLITAVNISVYCIWIPARLQISEKFVSINAWWDRCEKVIYLLVDASLNFFFIHIVRTNLMSAGLTKYKTLVRFNMSIIGVSLGMDVLIISMMSLHSTLVYMQFHPLAYMVKLNIEMSMADLIGKVASDQSCAIVRDGTMGDLEWVGGESMREFSLGAI